MGRRSISGRVRAKGRDRIQFDFEFEGVRYRPTLARIPTEANLRRARKQLEDIKTRIAHGTFNFSEEFPDFRDLKEVRGPQAVRRTCNQSLMTSWLTASHAWRRTISRMRPSRA